MHRERTPAGELRKGNAGEVVLVAGWVHKRRDFGDLIFIDLRDRTGIVQVVVDFARVDDKALVETASSVRNEYVLVVRGEVQAREEKLINPRMPTGEIEILASELRLLSSSEALPFSIEDDSSAQEETRLRYRYLDLRRPVLARNFMLRDRVAFRVRDYLHRNGFLEIETPILTKSTPEGARDFLVPSRVHPGEFYALPQSPQLFKQLLMVSGLERYYQIARCFRDEDLRRDRQPEFTQIDIEASFIDEEFIFELIEGMFREIFPLGGIEVPESFPRLTWQEAMDRFGIDRPDLRFGMEIIDIGELAATLEFPPFRQALDSGGLVRGIVVPQGARFSRKRLDELAEQARQFGAGGLIWVKFDTEKSSSIRKVLSPEKHDTLRTDMGAGEGDLALIVAGAREVVWEALGNLRLAVARDENMIPEDSWKFVWIVDFPLLEREQEGRWSARHHPFTSPRPEDLDRLESDPGSVMARAYDVVLNGLELGGGSIRIHTTELQSRMFRTLGISDEEAESRFGFLLDAFRYGAPPHGGIALGLDRMVMLMARAASLRDVIAFPKTTRAQDLMTEAPSSVDEAQLRDLGIALRPQS